MTFAALGDSAVLATLGSDAPSAASLAATWSQAGLPGVTDVVPAYDAVAVFYEPVKWAGPNASPHANICHALRAVSAHRKSSGPPEAESRLVSIPVCYGGEFGPDLESVARFCGLGAGEVVAIHSGAEYRVQAIGFTPGFPYLAGMDPRLSAPRRETPRPSVPAGSVGIAGTQTGVYSLESPGGWQLIGRTYLGLFRPRETPPALLLAGDRVKFEPVSAIEYARLGDDRLQSRPRAAGAAMRAGTPSIEVVKPGPFTTVQDQGRLGHRAAGVPRSGAMDPFALRIANALVGNPEDAAGLEITLAGPELVFRQDAWIAIGGAELEGFPVWRPWPVLAGQRLSFGACRHGCRAYLAVAGGIATEPELGSRSTYARAELGGLRGQALRAGDALPVGPSRLRPEQPAYFASPEILPAYSANAELRAVAAAQADEFGEAFWDSQFEATPRSDRMGLRLAGPKIVRSASGELASSPVAPGTVQIPPDGQPILLGADAQTIGGYPQAAHVASVDLPLAAQLRPGDRVRFKRISLEEAQHLALERERAFAAMKQGLDVKFSA